MTWIITKTKNIYHEGDERSRTHPGHGYPAYTETVKTYDEYESEDGFYEEVRRLISNKEKFEAYSAKKLKFTTKLEISVVE